MDSDEAGEIKQYLRVHSQGLRAKAKGGGLAACSSERSGIQELKMKTDKKRRTCEKYIHKTTTNLVIRLIHHVQHISQEGRVCL